ncbi:hypothetical protein BDV11DRAFT_56869 [Aspergillus similis]
MNFPTRLSFCFLHLIPVLDGQSSKWHWWEPSKVKFPSSVSSPAPYFSLYYIRVRLQPIYRSVHNQLSHLELIDVGQPRADAFSSLIWST